MQSRAESGDSARLGVLSVDWVPRSNQQPGWWLCCQEVQVLTVETRSECVAHAGVDGLGCLPAADFQVVGGAGAPLVADQPGCPGVEQESVAADIAAFGAFLHAEGFGVDVRVGAADVAHVGEADGGQKVLGAAQAVFTLPGDADGHAPDLHGAVAHVAVEACIVELGEAAHGAVEVVQPDEGTDGGAIAVAVGHLTLQSPGGRVGIPVATAGGDASQTGTAVVVRRTVGSVAGDLVVELIGAAGVAAIEADHGAVLVDLGAAGVALEGAPLLAKGNAAAQVAVECAVYADGIAAAAVGEAIRSADVGEVTEACSPDCHAVLLLPGGEAAGGADLGAGLAGKAVDDHGAAPEGVGEIAGAASHADDDGGGVEIGDQGSGAGIQRDEVRQLAADAVGDAGACGGIGGVML